MGGFRSRCGSWLYPPVCFFAAWSPMRWPLYCLVSSPATYWTDLLLLHLQRIGHDLLLPAVQTYWVPSYVKEKRFHNWLEVIQLFIVQTETHITIPTFDPGRLTSQT